MAHDGPGLQVDPRGAVEEEAERIQAKVEPDQSEQLRRTRVWRLDQFTGLGFDSAGQGSILSTGPENGL